MSENQNITSSFSRIFENLAILEKRNPDLKRLLNAFDGWLTHFVQNISETAERTAGPTASGSATGFAASSEGAVSDISNASQRPSVSPSAAYSSNEACSASEAEIPNTHIPSSPQTSSSPSISSSAFPQSEAVGEYVPVSSAPVVHEFTMPWRDEDIDQLEKRLLLKIEASRWALERDRLLKMSVDFQTQIEPRDHDLLTRARELTNCYLWMNNPETAPVIASETYEMLADAYNAAAQCVGFMRSLIALVDSVPQSEILSSILRDTLYTTATAQSALRRVTYEVSGREDQDQIRIHRWLTFLTKRYSIYVNRHMKKDSLAPKECIYKIPEYIVRLKEAVKRYTQRQKTLTESFSRIQYHAGRIQTQGGGDYDWKKIIETIGDLAEVGVSPDDIRFSDNLKHILCYLQDVPSYKENPFFVAVLMEMDYWHKNAAQKAQIAQELTSLPIRQASSEPEEEYQSVWKEELEEAILPTPLSETREKGMLRRGETLSSPERRSAMLPKASPLGFQEKFPQSERSSSREFGHGILSSSENSGENGTYAPRRSVQENSMPYRSEYHAPSRFAAHQDIPSYGDFSWERHSSYTPPYPSGGQGETLEEMIPQIQNQLQEKKIVFIADESGVQLLQILQSRLGDVFVFADEKQITSETKLAQLVHPGNVGLVMLKGGGTVSNLNRIIESYSRKFSKPKLRLDNTELQSVIHQIFVGLTFWK
ncbi:MAG: hypothetical protein IJD43_06765 [Thermoguttaceae bacterium]|nr:hypothetical protein [Planctomycetaceae bacterium]MBQ4143161.1 hypothetical protein [Thermoguttaceae bacterium]